MITGPKLAVHDNKESINRFMQFCHGVIEFHAFDLHFRDILRVEPLMKELRQHDVALSRLVIHMPFDNLDIFETTQRKQGIQDLTKLFKFLRLLSGVYGVEVALLTHCLMFNDYYERSGATSKVIQLLDTLWQNSNCSLLIENNIYNANQRGRPEYGYDSGWELACILDHYKIQMAFDTCHWEATQNLLRREMTLPKHIGSSIKHVHFSDTLDNDGFMNPMTHGRAHLAEYRMRTDLHKLESNLWWPEKTRKDLSLITEINEEDYVLRPHLFSELTMLEKFV